MSVCGQNGQAEDDSASEEVSPSATRDIYKQKPASKVVRVLTVLAYLLSVSLAAILLSVYYVCVWRSPEPPQETGGEASARRASPLHHHHQLHRHGQHSAHTSYIYGGGDTEVNATDIVQPSSENVPGDFTEDGVTEPITFAAPNVSALSDSTPSGLLLNGTVDFKISNDTDSVT
uniref:Transmembrane protein INAFM2 n=1 Tax=Heliothis virescens TaxID=7102 RepID=A0A2A4JLV1_HELVI